MALNTEDLCGRLDENRGYNMNTKSGLPVWPADPRAEDIRLEDVASALSCINRFNGHTKWDWVEMTAYAALFFEKAGHRVQTKAGGLSLVYMPLTLSVAQHSVNVMREVQKAVPGHRLLHRAALLHDAPEYVLGDMVKPQKIMYKERKQYEKRWEDVMAAVFGFPSYLFDHPAIKEADYRMFLTEKRDLCTDHGTDFGEARAEPYSYEIKSLMPGAAYELFMGAYAEVS